ncbi:hypothetical protein AGABI2DRAFT_65139 [Agaricus bisporus var. bisporus H97]|uniref:hypothetical protein n=1 Tax=Agaricus bisporus var. bisporus (strain H97 / ATCC MYA-4626 / FGSC 10389) TaxID=936046 RepID=UPI00029F5B85|nr:hypothetical protein AGABI2DRAFT_65139 [Agaricus bisporus var. bisporus H97]EKV50353.1 hypothetical protein AGABI2DRAFT_65139 [Agaricus bisporus var. bisporus H97]
MKIIAYLTAILGCLFRLACYVFLRVIPFTLAKYLLPPLYALHLLGLLLCTRKVNARAPNKEKSERETSAKLKSPTHPKKTLFSRLYSILLCLPSPFHPLNWANLAVNTLLLAAAAEFAITPFFDKAQNVTFTRVGAIYANGAKIVVRYPSPSVEDSSVDVLWREVSNGTHWQQGPTANLSQHSDWVATVKVENLLPDTQYEYILVDSNRTTLPYPSHPIRFSTFPDSRLAGGGVFRFLVSSCVTPNFPYRGPLHRKAIPGFELLAQSLNLAPVSSSSQETQLGHARQSPVDFLLFLGDFIYADVPVYIGDKREAYRRLYRRNYQNVGFRSIYEHIRKSSFPKISLIIAQISYATAIFHTYDDHEIINNYMGEENDLKPPYPNAADAFRLYNANANYGSIDDGQFYYDFRRGDTAFFVMDTRRYRSGLQDPDFSTRSMLGEGQLTALLSWLSQVNHTAAFKFVVSSVPFTTLWLHDAQVDSWAGFPTERRLLLDAFHTVPNVIILSGDRHEFAAIAFNGDTPESHTVYEFSTSPLSMFYLPLIRTLVPKSQDNVTRARMEVHGSEIREYIEVLPKEEVLKYLPIGNIKWSDIRVDTRNESQPLMYLNTFIDGRPSYKCVHNDHISVP